MKVSTYNFIDEKLIPISNKGERDDLNPNLVLVFGNKDLLLNSVYAKLSKLYPNSQIAICSTAGEISNIDVYDASIIVTTLSFNNTNIQTNTENIDNFSNSYELGKNVVKNISKEDLTYLLVLSCGSKVNGSELLEGIESELGREILITGGLAGDGPNFKSTILSLNEEPREGNVIIIGFYGKNLIVGHGSMGGWDVFGPEKIITKSDRNELIEIDGKNALDMYREYLGKYAKYLPSSALLFPISIIIENSQNTVVRTILSIDTEKNTMIFAGNVPEGSKIRFMKANFDNIIDGASLAASNSLSYHKSLKPDYALLISCVGRKLILEGRIDEEIEVINEIFENKTPMSGFYSYGELSPFNKEIKCQLHNQTMTITTFNEI